MLSDAYVPVAITDRSGFDESVHFGAAIAVDADGQTVASVGDPSVTIYPRSSLKPLQADAMLQAGLEATDEQVALACASHSGMPIHIDVARSTLADAGLDESALGNTIDYPYHDESANELIATGVAKSSILMNCSGKHAAMLATCVTNGWPTDTHLDPEHPLQRAITDHIESLAGPVLHIGVDGCGAPAHVIALRDLADAYRRLANTRSRPWSAMSTHPHLVAGPPFDSTRIMRAVPDLMAKGGAEGVFALALPDVGAVAVKISDGAGRAAAPVAAAMLRTLGVDVAHDAVGGPMMGHGQPVGALRPIVGAS
jgi:L-asparaginase II